MINKKMSFFLLFCLIFLNAQNIYAIEYIEKSHEVHLQYGKEVTHVIYPARTHKRYALTTIAICKSKTDHPVTKHTSDKKEDYLINAYCTNREGNKISDEMNMNYSEEDASKGAIPYLSCSKNQGLYISFVKRDADKLSGNIKNYYYLGNVDVIKDDNCYENESSAQSSTMVTYESSAHEFSTDLTQQTNTDFDTKFYLKSGDEKNFPPRAQLLKTNKSKNDYSSLQTDIDNSKNFAKKMLEKKNLEDKAKAEAEEEARIQRKKEAAEKLQAEEEAKRQREKEATEKLQARDKDNTLYNSATVYTPNSEQRKLIDTSTEVKERKGCC